MTSSQPEAALARPAWRLFPRPGRDALVIHALGIAAIVLLSPLGASAQLDRLFRGFGGGPTGGLSEVKIGSGLKEALQVGTQNAVNLTGKTDGYFFNQAIKILMPPKLQTMERGLRLAGYGPQVDDFVLSMNRAAERAAPAAKHIFWDAIGEMTFDDAQKILSGHQTAATDYFKAQTTDKLSVAFRPVVDQTMNEVGVTRQYKELVGRFEAIPFMKMDAFDLDGYVVGKALDGLFHMVGEEEVKIRTNPAARVTDQLKDVFGR